MVYNFFLGNGCWLFDYYCWFFGCKIEINFVNISKMKFSGRILEEVLIFWELVGVGGLGVKELMYF